MSTNDRCAEALESLNAGAPIPNTPALRALLVAIMEDGRAGIRFPDGIREVAREIRDSAAEPEEPWTDPKPWYYPNTDRRTAHPFPGENAERRPRTREQFDAEEGRS